MFAALFALFGCAPKPGRRRARRRLAQFELPVTATWRPDGRRFLRDGLPSGWTEPVVFPDCVPMETSPAGAYEQALVNAGFRQVQR